MVLASRNAYLTSQWFADQGFAVVITDGRGTPGRGPRWDREVHHNFASVTLKDQIDALQALGAEHPDLDMDRVAIRGWSYGGYLSALAAIRRPDVFHAAIAGAPVTDWTLYDTHYTERYVDTLRHNANGYELSNVFHWRDELKSHLLLVHGMADDNVLFANSTKLMADLQNRETQFRLMTYPGGKHGLSTPAMRKHVYTLISNYFDEMLKPKH
jgi:dipeptidyl-peptidase-4